MADRFDPQGQHFPPPPRGDFAELVAWRNLVASMEAGKSVESEQHLPARWASAGRRRCQNGHVSGSCLKSKAGGRVCLACRKPVILTFPEDREDP